MRIAFDPAFDLGVWPGPLGGNGDESAAIGEPWVGPIRLRGLLESALGLSGLYPSTAERVASLAGTVCTIEGFWSDSAQKDPIGVARTLLRWIDWLGVHGWAGEAPNAAKTTGRRFRRIRAVWLSIGRHPLCKRSRPRRNGRP